MKTSLKIKGPIPVILFNGGYYERKVRVARVTETVIVTINNDRSVSYYRRDTGRDKSAPRTGLASVCVGHLTGLKQLELWVERNGTKSKRYKLNEYDKPLLDENGNHVYEECYVYDSGFRTKYNSKGEQVYADECYPSVGFGSSQLNWLKSLGFRVVLLEGIDYKTDSL